MTAARCECGRPAVAFARRRGKSCRAVRAGKPVAMKAHPLCPACFEREQDHQRALTLGGKPMTATTEPDPVAVEGGDVSPDYFQAATERLTAEHGDRLYLGNGPTTDQLINQLLRALAREEELTLALAGVRATVSSLWRALPPAGAA